MEYGHAFVHSPTEIVNIRLTGMGVGPKIAPPQATTIGILDDALVNTAPCMFRVYGGLTRVGTPFYQCERLVKGVFLATLKYIPTVKKISDLVLVSPPLTFVTAPVCAIEPLAGFEVL
jgi:hypothetical protein